MHVQFILLLGKTHLNHQLFMKQLGRELSSIKDMSALILHEDNDYTKRIIQEGKSATEAKIQSVKDINRRLVTLLADDGVVAAGLHPFQKSGLTLTEDGLEGDPSFLLPAYPKVSHIISGLVHSNSGKEVAPITQVAKVLSEKYHLPIVILSDPEESKFKPSLPERTESEILNLTPIEFQSEAQGFRLVYWREIYQWNNEARYKLLS